ncbi:flagellar biosynthesis protein FlhF [Pseudoduganella umbonata]|uniref:Flagellar biosynthesis protein FlhF n=1 Tax=Pseudoduganella umbonata TaxID=864828 RepID=A0A4P8HP19_9BURK|nr:flagellar biosynthesis protein FlhF [Pseudoduganella umbonata]MBB3225083.1 flagellar biosynthesis protein FlhF [Pseudoduganella umbonata]QCP11447.1 flagellar biosynthesis protein FlhF [Pseudoduganella umbonata]
MNVKKFTAPTSREALRKVREALGPDAVILSNRPMDGVVEILALANDDAASLASPVDDAPPGAPHLDLDDGYAAAPAPVAARQPQMAARPAMQAPSAPMPRAPFAPSMPPQSMHPMQPPAHQPIQQATHQPVQQAMHQPRQQAMPPAVDMASISALLAEAVNSAKANAAAEMHGMMTELRAMRGMMETQLAELSWGSAQQREPHKAAVLRELLAAGFSATLARRLLDKLPAGRGADEALRWIRTVLARNIGAMANEDALIERGGVFALVGPTGVGKTTSTAKLAARCVMRHGPEKLALITTDAYRIGAHEQLRIYGKILGVMVHSVKDEADLRIALKELRNKHTVLIDTVGVSQRDQMVTEQVAMLQGTDVDVKRLLCLNATSTQETLTEVVRAYQGSGLAGSIITKLDEAASLGNVLDVVIRQKLQLFYVSNGQRVPEDLHLAQPAELVERAFRLKKDGSDLTDGELPMLMAAAGNDGLREVHLG